MILEEEDWALGHGLGLAEEFNEFGRGMAASNCADEGVRWIFSLAFGLGGDRSHIIVVRP